MKSLLAFVLVVAAVAAGAAPMPLNDGKTFNGWVGDTNKTWRIDTNGAFVGGSLKAQVPRNEFLRTSESYTNFILKLKFKLAGTNGFINGGVQIRSQPATKPTNEMVGYQCDIGPGWWGALYDESRRNKVLIKPDAAAVTKAIKPNDWNEYLIRARGNTIETAIILSVTSIIALTSVVGAKLMTNDGGGTSAGIGVLVMLALGAGLGALNGAVITLLRLPAFIVTLASMMFLSGFAIWLTQSKNIYGLPGSFLALGQCLPIALAITAALAVAAHLMLRCTVFGRWLYAVGQNATTAHISGVPVCAMTFAAYVASGFCAAVASVILTARLETGSPVLGREILLDIIGATVVGGTSLFGGKGKIAWTFFGVLFLTVLDNALILLSLSQFSITMTKGAVILFAAVLDVVRKQFVIRSS